MRSLAKLKRSSLVALPALLGILGVLYGISISGAAAISRSPAAVPETRAYQATTPSLAGPYAGTVSVVEPIALGVFDLAMLVEPGSQPATISATVELTGTLAFGGAPQRMQGQVTSGTEGSAPTFSLALPPFVADISGRQVTRSVRFEGEVLDEGRHLSGAYSEEIAGYTPEPITITGTFLLISGAGERVAEAQPEPSISMTIWSDPEQGVVGVPVELGVLLDQAFPGAVFANVPIRLFIGDPASGTSLGEVQVPFLEPGRSASSGAVSWTPPQAGSIVISAQLDPAQAVAGLPNAGMVVSRTLTVKPALADSQAPAIDAFTALDADGGVTNSEVHLSITASDEGSGVEAIVIAEYIASEGAGALVPVQVTPWLPYTSSPLEHALPLGPGPAERHLFVWARDAAGNISTYPGYVAIGYGGPAPAGLQETPPAPPFPLELIPAAQSPAP